MRVTGQNAIRTGTNLNTILDALLMVYILDYIYYILHSFIVFKREGKGKSAVKSDGLKAWSADMSTNKGESLYSPYINISRAHIYRVEWSYQY